MTNFKAPLYVGGAPVTGGNLPLTTGTTYYVDPTNGSDGNKGTSITEALSTLNKAYNLCTTNKYDTIVLLGNSTHTLSAPITWSKNRITVIGMDGSPRLVQQSSKVANNSTDTDAFVIKVTGTRNYFHNIKFIQNSTNAAALTCLQDGGEGNCFTNCSFTFGVADNLDQTNAFEAILGSDSATFIDCQFGQDTLLTSAARAVVSVDQVTSGQEFKSNRFRGCTFMMSSSSSTATFIRLAAVGDILFSNTFDDCNFVASIDSAGGAAVAEAVQTGTGTTKGTLNFGYPRAFGVTNFTTATSGRNTNVYVIGSVVTPEAKTDLVGVTPVAT